MWRERVSAVCLAAAAGMLLPAFFVLGDPRVWILVGSSPAVGSLILGNRNQRLASLGLLLFSSLILLF
ncbi:hypothetical protein SDC9_195231 [bioreactor metagenome]|uniref:Uncharacterized protein n=1 Tax=bioreactor metagenome TaxID=1076179 RepID=A0A645I8N4_9ZZZZ